MCLLSHTHPRYNKSECLAQGDVDMDPDEKEVAETSHVTNKTFSAAMRTLDLDDKKEKEFVKNAASGKKKFGEKTDEFINAASYAQRFMKRYKTADHIPDHEVPKEYDLRNIEGYDFTGSLRDQGPCGSCYSNSFIQAVEGRMKLKYAHTHIDMPDLSIQFIMTCNYLTEGCDGGWAIFDGFFAEQGGIPTEKCAPYTAKTKGARCSDFKSCEPHTLIKSSYYVNGYNFDPTEMQIRKEILMNGPVTTEFKADEDFQLYKSGVMVQGKREPEKDNSANYAQVLGNQISDELVQTKAKSRDGQEDDDKIIMEDSKKTEKAQSVAQTEAEASVKMAHQPLDHSIYIVGWGHDKEKDMPYWIIRNSYGDQWGMNADFHVRRGQDDYGVESEITAFDVELAQNDS